MATAAPIDGWPRTLQSRPPLVRASQRMLPSPCVAVSCAAPAPQRHSPHEAETHASTCPFQFGLSVARTVSFCLRSLTTSFWHIDATGGSPYQHRRWWRNLLHSPLTAATCGRL